MRSDIEKIDEQIEAIQNTGKKVKKNDQVKEETVPFSDTKKIDKIDSIAENVEEVAEDTKKIDTIEEEKPNNSEMTELVNNLEEIPVVADQTDEGKKQRKKIPVKYIILGSIIGILIIILLVMIFRKDGGTSEKTASKDLSEKEKKQIITNYGDSISALIGYYKTKEDRLLTYAEVSKMVKLDYQVTCRETEIHEDTTVYLNKCSIDGTNVKYSYGVKMEVEEEVLPEGVVRVYVTSSGAYLKKPKSGIKYEQYDVTINESYLGLKLLDSKSDYLFYIEQIEKEIDGNGGKYISRTNRLVNFKTGKKALENVDYSHIALIVNGGKYDPQFVVATGAGTNYYNNWRVYNLETGELALDEKYRAVYANEEGVSLINGYLLVDDSTKNKNNNGIIDYKTGNLIVPTEYSHCNALGKTMFNCFQVDNNYNTTSKYLFDLSGKQKLTNVEVVDASADYAFVRDGGKIKTMDYDGKVLYDYGVLNISDALMYGSSYKNGYMVKFVNGEKPFDYDHDMNDSCVSIIYYPETKKGEVKKSYCYKIDKD